MNPGTLHKLRLVSALVAFIALLRPETHRAVDAAGLSGYANVRELGAKGDGKADDSEAFAAAAASGKNIYAPAGTYLVTRLIVLDHGQILTGDGIRTRLRKARNGAIFDVGRHSGLEHVLLDGDGAHFNGAIVQVGKGANVPQFEEQGRQTFIQITAINCGSYCIEYTEPNKGWMSLIAFSDFHTINPKQPAIRWPAEPTKGGNRGIYGCYSSGILVDASGADNGKVMANDVGGSGGSEEGIVLDAASKKVIILGNRFAVADGVVSVRGGDNIFRDNVVAGSVDVDQTCNGCTVDAGNTALDGDIRKLLAKPGNNRIVTRSWKVYTPQWTGGKHPPQLGNGSLVGRYRVEGRRVFVSVTLTLGSTTTLGEGPWIFSVPFVPELTAWQTGSGLAGAEPCTSVLKPELGGVVLYFTGGAQAGPAVPRQWAPGQVATFTLEYLL